MKAALVLIDLQNDYLSAPALQPAAGQIIQRAGALLDACRQLGLPIIHVWTTTHRDIDDRMPHWKSAGKWSCEDGAKGHETPEMLKPRAGEHIVHKQFFSSFGSPQMDAIVRSTGADTLILAGVHLHGCVRATAMDAYQRGLTTLIADDAIGSDDPIHSAITRRYLETRGARFSSVSRVLEMVSVRGEAAISIEHRAPADNSRILFNVRNSTAQEVSRAANRATPAQRMWRGFDIRKRAEPLRKLADLLKAQRESLAHQITEEIGKPISMSRAEVDRSVALLHGVADRVQEPQNYTTAAGAGYRYQPLGVVAVITPWNNPLAIPIGKITPAILYGNAVVWKPSPPATRIAERIAKLFRASGCAAGDEDIVHVLSGDHSAACLLAADEHVDGVTLSGSLQAGYSLQEICARRHISYQGELGGNNAAIVWDDCDLVLAATQIAAGAFGFAGQRCTANRRAIVAESIFPKFMSELRKAVEVLKWGDPWDESISVGPLINVAKRDAVAALLQRARASGVEIIDGPVNHPDHARLMSLGAYYLPTIAVVNDPQHEIVQEETFGPVLVVQRASTLDEAIALMNGVRQGLVAALFSNSPERRKQFMAEAQAGVLKFNRSTVDADAVSPLGGWKASGVGPAEHGPSDREFFCRVQTIYGEGHA